MSQSIKVSSPGTVTIGDLVFTPDSVTPPPINHAPVVNAGIDQQITLPLNYVNLTGKATDPDTGGSIVAYIWEIISGSGNIESPSSQNTKVSELTKGTTVLRLTAIDDQGASGTDDINILIADVVIPPTPGYKLIYSNGFNTTKDLDPFGHGQIGNGSLDTKVFKTAPGSFKSRPANVSSGNRSEVQFDKAQSPDEGAIEWDVIYNVIAKGSCHSFQLHPETGGGSASPGLWHDNGNFLWNNWKGGTNTGHSTGVKIPQGKWMKMRIEFKKGSSGYFRHFIDGVKVCEWAGQVGDGSEWYVKCGLNGWGSDTSSSDINYDNFSVYVLV